MSSTATAVGGSELPAGAFRLTWCVPILQGHLLLLALLLGRLCCLLLGHGGTTAAAWPLLLRLLPCLLLGHVGAAAACASRLTCGWSSTGR